MVRCWDIINSTVERARSMLLIELREDARKCLTQAQGHPFWMHPQDTCGTLVSRKFATWPKIARPAEVGGGEAWTIANTIVPIAHATKLAPHMC